MPSDHRRELKRRRPRLVMTVWRGQREARSSSLVDNILQFVRSQEKNKKQEVVTPARNINAAVDMRLMNVTGFFPSLELNFYCWRYNGSRNLATVLLPDLGQLLLDELVQYPVLLADVVSHDGLPVWVVFVVTARHGADVGLLGGGLELTNRTDLDCVLSGVSGNPH